LVWELGVDRAMKKNVNNKGFTLVELIIVIAIIGILAAVLIPTISGYITKAHRGRDVELAGHMTTDVTLYATEYDVNINEFTGVDVRTILLFKDYDLKPRKDGWVFAFDKTTNQVVVLDINKDGTVSSNSAPSDPIDPTHIEDNYYLVSKGNSDIEKAVNLMVNLTSEEDYTTALALVDGEYEKVIKCFDPKTTVFLDNGGVFTTATSYGSATKMVVLELTSSLPKIPKEINDTLNLSGDVVYSNTVRTSDPKSQLKSLFKDVKDVDLTKIYKIDLPAFGSNAVEGTSIYTVEFGKYVGDSFKQTVIDEIIGIVPGSGGNQFIIKRQLTVSYYNNDGLFAQGSIVYAVLQTFN
jgi:type IV pilus assembly protein PilA